jgi:hypothetical protein
LNPHWLMPAPKAGIFASRAVPRRRMELQSYWILAGCALRMAAVQHKTFASSGPVYDCICRSNAPPPAKLRFQPVHFSSHGTSVKTAALLLPVAVRSSKSLPDLLPRQAFFVSSLFPTQIKIECSRPQPRHSACRTRLPLAPGRQFARERYPAQLLLVSEDTLIQYRRRCRQSSHHKEVPIATSLRPPQRLR